MRGAHDPPRFRGRCDRHGSDAQHQRRDAGGLRGQCEFAAGDKIERFRRPPEFDHHRAQRIAGQGIGGDTQSGLDISRAHGDDLPWIEAKLAPTVHRQHAGFHLGEILPHPQQRFPRNDPARQTRNETRCRRCVTAAFGEHLVQRTAQQPAAQRRIGFGMAERNAPSRIVYLRRVEMRDVPSQTRKHAFACAGLAPLLSILLWPMLA